MHLKNYRLFDILSLFANIIESSWSYRVPRNFCSLYFCAQVINQDFHKQNVVHILKSSQFSTISNATTLMGTGLANGATSKVDSFLFWHGST